jgi:tRNA threonylcarbamoyladenosine biosynthesis protein TsaE
MNRLKISLKTRSFGETQSLAEKIGALLPAGVVIALTGDLGSGKTTFVQGLARGLQVPAEYYITSPTFTLINEYPGRLPLHHVDLYRIGHPEEADDIGLFDMMHGDGVTVIEWAERIQSELPEKKLQIHFEMSDWQSRKMTLIATGSVAVTMLKRIAKKVEEKKWG